MRYHHRGFTLPEMLVPVEDRRGTTLLEIMIVVALIGIMAGVVIPSGASSAKPYRVIEQARIVHSELARLRARAVAEQKGFEVELANGTVTIKRENNGAFATLKNLEMPSGMTAELNGSPSGSVVFYPSGRVDAAATLVISDGHSEHTIRILASGMTRWESQSQ